MPTKEVQIPNDVQLCRWCKLHPSIAYTCCTDLCGLCHAELNRFIRHFYEDTIRHFRDLGKGG